MENALIVALSQACRYLRDPTLDPRVKQFLKRELGSELVSLENRKKSKLRLLQEVREYIRLGRKKHSCSLLAAGIRKKAQQITGCLIANKGSMEAECS